MRRKILLISFFCFSQTLFATRIKDVAKLEGVTETQLIGYGLVVGLKGTGDGNRTQFTTQSIINMLRNMGIEVPQDKIQLRNVAAVMVTGNLMPYSKKGAALDVSVSSIGDARSLEGGVLLLSPLQAADGEIYALAQGSLSVGGFLRESGHSSFKKNYTLVGDIPGGAIVQKASPLNALPQGSLDIALHNPDFSSAVALAKALNAKYQKEVAQALDPGTVHVTIPDNFKNKTSEFMAEVENVDFQTSTVAKVILNERTGTVVAGGNVTLSEVAVSQGSITVEIKQNQQSQTQGIISQGQAAQQTTKSEGEDMKVEEAKNEMRVIPANSNVNDLAKSLNALGISPRDIIAIFQAIKKAGALNAELIIM